ncbi:hypothetical protein D3C81_1163300 [compost metagenome]
MCHGRISDELRYADHDRPPVYFEVYRDSQRNQLHISWAEQGGDEIQVAVSDSENLYYFTGLGRYLLHSVHYAQRFYRDLLYVYGGHYDDDDLCQLSRDRHHSGS